MPFKEGNKLAKKSPKVVIRKMQEMYRNALIDNEILSFQDACYSISWRPSKIAYWTSTYHVFELFKKDIQDAIISRVNKKALKNEFNATASIWRQKQLGERDEQHINTTGTTRTEITVTSKEAQEEVEKLREKFDNE